MSWYSDTLGLQLLCMRYISLGWPEHKQNLRIQCHARVGWPGDVHVQECLLAVA